MINYDEQASKIYSQYNALDEWEDPAVCAYQTLQLVSTDITKATEGEREDLTDGHLPGRKMGEVGLADALIRVLGMGGRYGWTFNGHVKAPEECSGDMSIGGKHLFINSCLIGLTNNLPHDLVTVDTVVSYHYSRLVSALVATAESQGYDIEGAMAEKLAYNKANG